MDCAERFLSQPGWRWSNESVDPAAWQDTMQVVRAAESNRKMTDGVPRPLRQKPQSKYSALEPKS